MTRRSPSQSAPGRFGHSAEGYRLSVASSPRTPRDHAASHRTDPLPRRAPLRMTTARRLLIALLATCLCAVAPAGVALADGDDVLRDCNDNGKLDKGYSQGDLRDAIENIPTDLDEYTDCRDVIRRAQLGLGGSGGGSGSGSGGSGGGAGGSVDGGVGGATGGGTGGGGSSANATEALANATPEEKAALAERTASGGTAPVRIGEVLVGPRVGVSSSTSLPTPLIVVLVLLSLVGLAGAGLRVTKLVGARRS